MLVLLLLVSYGFATTRVLPRQKSEIPFDASISYGRGWSLEKREFVGHAFKPYDPSQIKRTAFSHPTVKREMLLETSSFADMMSGSASVQASGWGMSAKAEASFSRDVTMTSKDVIFMLHINKDLGFEGWKHERTPDFTEAAKRALCDQTGAFTPEVFERIYGTYYVIGERKASSLDVFLRVQTETSSSEEKFDASLEMEWGGFGASVNGGAKFSTQLTKKHSKSRVKVFSKAYGVTRNWVPKPDINNLDAIYDSYEEVSENGGGVALELERYQDHRDYISIQQRCGRTFSSFEVEEEFENKMVSIAVEAKLLAQEIEDTDLDLACAWNLMSDLYRLYESILKTPADQVGYQAWQNAKKQLKGMKALWDSQHSICTGMTAQEFLLSGSSVPCMNGLYTHTGSKNGAPYFTKSDGGLVQYENTENDWGYKWLCGRKACWTAACGGHHQYFSVTDEKKIVNGMMWKGRWHADAIQTFHTTGTYVGCYVDDASRDLNHGPKAQGYTHAQCSSACEGYAYFALQAFGWCFCGDAYATRAQYIKKPDAECSTLANGGHWRNAVFRQPVKAKNKNKKACPAGYYVIPNDRCHGNGTCCGAGWSESCGLSCAKDACIAAHGQWIVLDYTSNPYTCKMSGRRRVGQRLLKATDALKQAMAANSQESVEEITAPIF